MSSSALGEPMRWDIPAARTMAAIDDGDDVDDEDTRSLLQLFRSSLCARARRPPSCEGPFYNLPARLMHARIGLSCIICEIRGRAKVHRISGSGFGALMLLLASHWI